MAFELSPAIQPYAWGKPGSTSAVADLAQNSIQGFERRLEDPYAELWMGTHPKGPCLIPQQGGATLSSWLQANPSAIGRKVVEQFPKEGQLPYLFKVLSVNKALSIQAHPSKSHAEQLHRERPDKYPDDNHKPEMAIAITPFEALCGFRPRDEITRYFNSVPEFYNLIGPQTADDLINATNEETIKSSLQKCFTALMTCEKSKVEESLGKLVTRLQEQTSAGQDTCSCLGELLLRLNSQFPGDVGCFSIYFLNRMLLNPGEAIFLEANLPHAYLAGDCMECMACSDNVVRAGLTPKYIDVPTLCSMLKYECKPASDNKFSPRPHPTDPFVTIYSPPVPDFAVDEIKVPDDTSQYTMPPVDSGSILLVLQGAASVSDIPIKRGKVLFVPANEQLTIKLEPKSDGLLAFRAYCDL